MNSIRVCARVHCFLACVFACNSMAFSYRFGFAVLSSSYSSIWAHSFRFLRCCCCNFIIIIFLCLTWFQLVFFCFIWIIVCSYCDCCRLVLVFPKIFVIFCYVRFVWVAHSLVLSMSLHACFLQVRYIRFLCACVFITYILTHNKFIPRLTEDWAYTDKNVFTSECVVFFSLFWTGSCILTRVFGTITTQHSAHQ